MRNVCVAVVVAMLSSGAVFANEKKTVSGYPVEIQATKDGLKFKLSDTPKALGLVTEVTQQVGTKITEAKDAIEKKIADEAQKLQNGIDQVDATVKANNKGLRSIAKITAFFARFTNSVGITQIPKKDIEDCLEFARTGGYFAESCRILRRQMVEVIKTKDEYYLISRTNPAYQDYRAFLLASRSEMNPVTLTTSARALVDTTRKTSEDGAIAISHEEIEKLMDLFEKADRSEETTTEEALLVANKLLASMGLGPVNSAKEFGEVLLSSNVSLSKGGIGSGVVRIHEVYNNTVDAVDLK